jgi:hypothetical protein
MQLQDVAGPQLEGTFLILYVGAYHFEREVELANAIFGLTPRYLLRIFQKGCRFGNTMPILNQGLSPGLFCVQLSVQVSNHFARYTLVLNMSVAISEATPLFPKLVGGHLNFACPLNEFL